MAMDRLREYAQEHKDKPWIVGCGWLMSWFEGGSPESTDLLDEAVPDRPCVLTSFDGHSCWVNKRALELVGITTHTPEPTKGKIRKNSKGELNGVFQGFILS
jgi:predicted amidohydrolase YtcJ